MNIKKKYQNISRNYFDIIRKKNYSPSYGGHPKNKSFFCESHKNNIYKRKVCPIDQKRNSISQNNSKNNIKKENNFEDTNSRKRNPINNLKDSYYLNTLDNYNFGRILPEQKSLGKENDYSNSSRINFNPNLNIINEDEGNDYIKFNHSPKFKNNYQLIELLEQNNKLQNEIIKLKINFEEYKNKEKEKDLNQVKEEYTKLKKEYDLLKEEHSILINKYNKIRNSNEELYSERIEINKAIDEIYNSQYQNNENYDFAFSRIDSLEEENNRLKNKLKIKSSFFQNLIIEHFKLSFISEVTKKCDENIKIKNYYHTPEKKNNKMIKNNDNNETNKNYIKLDDYNELNKKYIDLKNKYNKIINDFNITNNQNAINSFCIINNVSENLPDASKLDFKDINQNEDPKHLLRKNKINSLCSNSIIQCLIHVNKLFVYFINDYPKNSRKLKRKNKNINVSDAFYSLIKDIFQNKDKFSYNNSVSLKNFKDVISSKNSQIFYLNCGEFLLNLLQIFHEELNYLVNKNVPNSKSFNSFNDFNKEYKMHNSSIISDLFFGTFEYKKQCKICKNTVLDFKKFKFLSFGISKQYEKVFNIYNGFEDNEKAQISSFPCDHCKKYCEFEKSLKIVEPPKELLININYYRFKPSKIDFDKIIDITKYVSHNFGASNKYRINCICSKTESNYFIYKWNRDNEKWYIFDNSSFKECKEKDIYLGNPYLLLYERL